MTKVIRCIPNIELPCVHDKGQPPHTKYRAPLFVYVNNLSTFIRVGKTA